MSYSYKCYSDTKDFMKKFVNAEEGAIIYGISKSRISPIFKFSKEVRTAFYTTNAIESLNSCYRRLNKQRSVFPSSQALLKALYLGTFEIIS